tara:strand:+ start:478 stop:972 length:495 start_codon:yes stop_codon:yes gene_type:complete
MSKIEVNEIARRSGSSPISIPGHVIQVVQGTYASFTNTTSSSFVDVGLSAAITPVSSSNKILVKVAAHGIAQNGATAKTELALLRGSTIIQYALRPVYSATSGSGEYITGSCAIEFLDSPSTTSATTYKLQFRTRDGGDSTRFNDYHTGDERSTSTITLMEIAQ